jgi:hypothetical protein
VIRTLAHPSASTRARAVHSGGEKGVTHLHSIERLLDIVGLATPFGFAWAIYRLFAWADCKASEPLKRSISAWLKREPYQRVDWQSAVVDMMFDRLYTRPLLRPKAFLRSAIVSVATFIGFIFISSSLFSYESVFIVSPYLISVVASDYVSLFVVRRGLLFFNNYPMISLLSSFLIGCIVIIMTFYLDWRFNDFLFRHLYMS